MPTKSEPWERRDDESAKAYEAYQLYRESGAKRSTAKVAVSLRKSKGLIQRWSRRHQWGIRTRAYDERIAKAQAAEELTSADRMNKRHIAESQKMQETVLRYLKDFDPKRLQARDVPAWLKVATEMERKCMGLDQGSQVSVGVQVNIDDRQVILATKLYPKAVSMLTEGQRAELEAYRKSVEDGG